MTKRKSDMYTGPEQLDRTKKVDALVEIIAALDLTGRQAADAIWEASNLAADKRTAKKWYEDVRESLSPWEEW